MLLIAQLIPVQMPVRAGKGRKCLGFQRGQRALQRGEPRIRFQVRDGREMGK